MGSLPASVRIVHKDSSDKWCMKGSRIEGPEENTENVQFGHSFISAPQVSSERAGKRVGLRSGRGGAFNQSLAAEDVLSCVAMDVVTAALIIGPAYTFFL